MNTTIIVLNEAGFVESQDDMEVDGCTRTS